MSRTARLENSLTPAQLNLISLTLFVAIFPVTYCMYLHWKSMQRRYGDGSDFAKRQEEKLRRSAGVAPGASRGGKEEADGDGSREGMTTVEAIEEKERSDGKVKVS
ncbi:hypothetical protein IAU60_004498 [Kwoniella sp. DSM 27419]